MKQEKPWKQNNWHKVQQFNHPKFGHVPTKGSLRTENSFGKLAESIRRNRPPEDIDDLTPDERTFVQGLLDKSKSQGTP